MSGVEPRIDDRKEESTSSLLEVENLSVSFRSRGKVTQAVDQLSLTIRKGEAIGLVGESGSGKSVTNLAILGLLPKDSARVEATRLEFDGTDLRDLSKEELRSIRGNEIAMVFQDPMTALNPFMRIETQMAEVLEAHTNLDKRAIRNRCVELLGRVGIPEPENRIRSYPHEFSGGMRQRVLIAMALLAEPRLLIADEPTTALDVTIQKQILDLLRELVRERGLSMILVTHDLGVVAEAVDRVVVLYGGQVMEVAPTESLFRNPVHPYTRALLTCLPRLEREAARLEPIPGAAEVRLRGSVGCAFAPRCPQATESCVQERPPMEKWGDSRQLACWNADREGEWDGNESTSVA